MSDIERRIREIIGEQLGVHADKLTHDARLASDLGADSFDAVEIVLELEDEFDICIPDDAVERCTTFGDVVKGIEQTLTP